MAMITEIAIDDNKGFFADKKFTWSNISFFSIIAGINGSGKTQLLEYVTNSDSFNRSVCVAYGFVS